jgi:L-asparagine oxygenase
MDSIELTKHEITVLTNLALEITANPSSQQELFCEQCKELSKYIPDRIKKSLICFKENGNEQGYILITTNANNNEIPKTPCDNNSKVGETTITAKTQSILIHTIADLIAYEAEGYGRLFQDIVPVKNMETKQTSIGSNTELEIHTEQAFSKLRPDLLSLACLRGDPKAITYILPIRSIINNLSDHENRLLRQPLWKIGVDLSFKLYRKEFIDGEIRGPIPIIYGSYDNPMLVFDQDLMIGITEEANAIIKKIVDIYYLYRYQHNLQPGEMIIIDNRRSVHGRSSFSPRYDGDDRFLIRCFGVFDYEKSKYARAYNTRVVSAIYS